MRKYKITYQDKFGIEETEILSNGSTMFITLRGVDFEGVDFELLEGEIDHSKFEYEDGILTNFTIKVSFPIKVIHHKIERIENIEFIIEVGENLPIEGLNSIVNTVSFKTSFGVFSANKKVEWFEDAIINIQSLLPKNTIIKTCLSCKFSHYHPCGNGMFGGLFCLKNSKVQTKEELFYIIDEKSLNVQEIYDCSSHQFITKEDWVYKDWNFKIE